MLGDLGATLLELVHGDLENPDEIGGIAIHDPLDEAVLPRHALVLGVGLHAGADIAALLAALGTQQAAGLIVRAPVPTDPELKAAAAESGVALLGFTRGASWTQLAAVLRSLLAEGDVGVTEPESLGGLPAGDLFALANAIAALLDAPITIEDRNSRVLAFSGRQDEADPSRVETILGRQVPERYSRILGERGVFRDLYRSDQTVYVEPLPRETDDFTLPRVAVAVRAGDEVLGSIWAAVHGPLTAERDEALRDAAKLVALHMLRVRAGADVERRLRADLVGTALEGGTGAREALSRLGLADQPVAVFALTLPRVPHEPGADGADGPAAAAALIGERQRLADAFAMHLSAVHPGSAAALVSDIVYGLVPIPNQHTDGEQRALRIAAEFLERVGSRARPVVAVGPVARDVAGLARSARHRRPGRPRAARRRRFASGRLPRRHPCRGADVRAARLGVLARRPAHRCRREDPRLRHGARHGVARHAAGVVGRVR